MTIENILLQPASECNSANHIGRKRQTILLYRAATPIVCRWSSPNAPARRVTIQPQTVCRSGTPLVGALADAWFSRGKRV